jgi:hypothetical protein
MLIKGAMNGETFLAYIEQCLAPALRRRDIVILDNVPFHKVSGVDEAIQARRAELRYLPSAPSKGWSDASAPSFGRSSPPCAQAISGMLDMIHYDRDML